MSDSKAVIVPDPIPYLVPFLPPRRGPVKGPMGQKLLSWCNTILPGVAVEIEEWIGADPRHPLHIVVVSFPESDRPSIRLTSKAEDLVHADLLQVLTGKE